MDKFVVKLPQNLKKRKRLETSVVEPHLSSSKLPHQMCIDIGQVVFTWDFMKMETYL